MPRLLKRLALLLLTLVIMASALVYTLYFRRTPLSAATPHARVVPAISTIPGLAACWVETGKTFSNFSFGSTAGSVLVKHPAGDLLIDTGNSSHFAEEVRRLPILGAAETQIACGRTESKSSAAGPATTHRRRSRQGAVGDSFARASRPRGRADGLAADAGAADARRAAICERSKSAGQRFHDRGAHSKISVRVRADFEIRSDAL